MKRTVVKAKYDLTADDVGALASFQARNDFGYRYSRRWQAGTLALIIVLVGAAVAARQDSLREASVPLGLSILIASYCAIVRYREYPKRFAHYAKSRYLDAESRGSLGIHEISIDDTGVSITNDHFDSRIRWSMIVKVERTQNHIFAFTGPLHAVINPKRSLEGADFGKTYEAMRDHGAA